MRSAIRSRHAAEATRARTGRLPLPDAVGAVRLLLAAWSRAPALESLGLNVRVAGIRDNERVSALAVELRDQCALRGVHLLADEAEEMVLEQVRRIAAQLRVTERTVLATYPAESAIDGLVEAVGDAGGVVP